MVVVSCSEGYYSSQADQTLKCLSSGTWSPDPTPCQRIMCPPVEAGATRSLNKSAGEFLGSKVIYICNAGHNLHNSKPVHTIAMSRTCSVHSPARSEVGYWSRPVLVANSKHLKDVSRGRSHLLAQGRMRPQNCHLVLCKLLENPVNGTVTLAPAHFGLTAVYGCDKGYQLEKGVAPSRTCLANDTWSGVEPRCEGEHSVILQFFGVVLFSVGKKNKKNKPKWEKLH